MKELIENLLIEDPNLKFEINEENGEFLLSGVGPLHLEITANEIEKRVLMFLFQNQEQYSKNLVNMIPP